MRNLSILARQLCLLTCLSTLAACTSADVALTGPPTKTISKPIDKRATAKVVFFHDAIIDTAPSQIGATVISTQGEIISGLHPQQYTIISSCDGNQAYQITRGGKAATSIKLTTTPNSVYYVKLTPSSTSSAINYKVSKHYQLGDVIKSYDKRSFLVTRHYPNCTTPSEPTTFNFNSEALFAFDGAELVDVLANHPLENLVSFIEKNITQPMRITVSGYTDYLGDRHYNQQLSEQRAQTVANYLKSKGYSGSMQVFGFGSADPIVTDCSSTSTQDELVQCLQPNRRVTVRIWQAN
jgi:outer membrane protein OmpA-like peptidoglycan-associated protein